MNIKKIIFAIFASFICTMALAQEEFPEAQIIANEDSCSTESIQSAIDACMMLADAADANDPEALRKAKEAMEECGLAPFGILKNQNKDENESLDGHLVFNVAFADSLAEGRDAYKDADLINKSATHRGQMPEGKILTKTVLIKANGKSVYTFKASDREELAVVAEPGGRVTTRVHAVNSAKGFDKWFNDTTEVAKGKNSRKTAFSLPNHPRTDVTLEITNCTDKDISVVVISN